MLSYADECVWCIRNTVFRDFVAWLRGHNSGLPMAERIGVFGLDLYSMYEAGQEVIEFLERVDPDTAKVAIFGHVVSTCSGTEHV